jgi:hypothetical protein
MDVKVKGLAVSCGAGGWGAGSFEWINELTQRSVSDGKEKVKGKGAEATTLRGNDKWVRGCPDGLDISLDYSFLISTALVWLERALKPNTVWRSNLYFIVYIRYDIETKC